MTVIVTGDRITSVFSWARPAPTTVRHMVGNCQALSELNRRAVAGTIESPDSVYSSVVAGSAGRADPRAGRGRIRAISRSS